MRKEIPKEETRNKYGDAARKIEIEAIGKHGAFIYEYFFSDIAEGEMVRECEFVYKMKTSKNRLSQNNRIMF